MTDTEHFANLWRWLWPWLFVWVVGIVVFLGAYQLERARFDGCIRATNDHRYCTLAYPWGAHR